LKQIEWHTLRYFSNIYYEKYVWPCFKRNISDNIDPIVLEFDLLFLMCGIRIQNKKWENHRRYLMKVTSNIAI